MKRSVLAAICALTSCASLHAPAGPAAPKNSESSLVTSLVAIEGRPAGVVLRLTCGLSGAKAVELYRIAGEGQPLLLQELAVDDQLAESLGQGLEIVDSTVFPGEQFTYQLFVIGVDDEVLDRSAVAEVSWAPSPKRPHEVVATAVFVDAVELVWPSDPSLGAVVFRRDVLTDGRFERVASVRAPARGWVDRDVSAGGVWSYRIAYALQHDSGLVQFGPPSEEVYASTPEVR